MRPNWDEYFLGIANAVATRADCSRRRVGAVIADLDNRIIATGYNGAEPGGPSCLAGECPRGRHFPVASVYREKTCACGQPWPCADAVAPGSSYDSGPGACIATHAEANALLFARSSVQGCDMYVTEEPCAGCWRLIKSAGIDAVYTPNGLAEA